MKRLLRAGSYYLWALTVEKCLGIAVMVLAGGAAIAAMYYAAVTFLGRW